MPSSSELRAELSALAGLETGRRSGVAGPYVAEDLGGPAGARLISARPRLRVQVTVLGPQDIACAVLSGLHELGLGAVEAQVPHEDLSIDALRQRRLFLACRPGHPLAGGNPTRAQLLDFPFVTVLMRGQVALARSSGSL